MDLISLLVLILILGVVFWLATYIVDQLPMPAPFKVAARVLVALIVLLVFLRRTGLA